MYNSITTVECVRPESREVSRIYEQANHPFCCRCWVACQLFVIFLTLPLAATVAIFFSIIQNMTMFWILYRSCKQHIPSRYCESGPFSDEDILGAFFIQCIQNMALFRPGIEIYPEWSNHKWPAPSTGVKALRPHLRSSLLRPHSEVVLATFI